MMGPYANAAPYYDLLYGFKDYDAEAEVIAATIREAAPGARTILDVACGTGKHAAALVARGFHVDGVDLEPRFLELARARCPSGAFTLADMTSLDLGLRYDAVVCLFSSIGYVLTVPRLEQTVARLAAHVAPGGVLLLDPWFEPGELTHGFTMATVGESEGLRVTRSSRTLIEGDTSLLEFTYVVERGGSVEEMKETHALGLFTREQTCAAFARAGLSVQVVPSALRKRLLYVGTHA